MARKPKDAKAVEAPAQAAQVGEEAPPIGQGAEPAGSSGGGPDIPPSEPAQPGEGQGTQEGAIPNPGAALATTEIDSEVVQRMQDAIESLESFTDLKLPVIKFGKEGFGLVDGDPAVESFQGVLLFTKESNVYYEKAYKAGQNLIPDCASSDGIKPNTPNPKHPTCKGCPMNQFGSSKVGDGKACKNTRPMFFLLGGSIMPRVLRVPPSSLVYVRNYVQRVAMDFGKYWGVITRVTIWKKEESQEYNNIKFTFAGTLPKTCQRDATGEIITQLGNKEVDALRAQWLQFMKVGNFGIDEPTNDTAASPYPDTPPEAADSGQPGAEPQF